MGFFKSFVEIVTGAAKSAAKTLGKSFRGGGIKGIFSAGLKQFAISFIATAIFSFAYKKLAGKPKQPDFQSFDSEVTQRSTIIRNPISPRQIVYGTIKKSGVLLYASTTSTSNTSDNKFLNLVIALASHEIQGVTKVYFNDTEIQVSGLDGNGNVTSGTYANKAKIKINLGADNQTADSDLVSEDTNITSNHRFRGIAYLYVRLEFDADVYPNGIPNISALIQGRKVLDYRNNSTAYSANPALIIYNYLISPEGMGAATSEIDTSSFTTAANNCDTNITITGGTQKRYEAHGVINLNQKPIEVIDDILSSCVGILTYEQGLFKLKVGVATSSVKTINESDLINEINVRAKPKRQDLYNQVRGTFADEANNYIATDFPIKESTSYQTADGEVVSREINLPFTTNNVMAQRIALILLKQSRNMITLNFQGKANLLNLSVGDVCTINLDKLGFSSKLFQITSFTLNENLTCNITAQEYETTVYDFNASTEETTLTTPNNINLPNAFSVSAPTNLVLGDELRIANEGIVTTVLTASATISDDAFVGRYECQFKKTTDSVFTVVGIATSPVFDIHGIIDGITYDVQIRAINNIGAKSSFLTGQHTVIGELAPPSDVTGLACNIVGKDAHISFDAVPDLDLAFYQLRYSTATIGAEWNNSVLLVEKISRPATSITVPARVGSYLIKAFDKSLNSSTNATIISTNIASLIGFNNIASSTQNPNFDGNKTDIIKSFNENLNANILVLDSISLFDSKSGNFDDNTTQFFDSGGILNNTKSSGKYEFDNVIDIGAVATARVTASLNQSSTDRDELFDAQTVQFDSKSGAFDGSSAEQSDAILQIAVSNDNVTYSSFQNFVVGDYSGRFFKFQCLLISRNNSATPFVIGLAATVDAEDRTQAENNLSVSSSGLSITYPTSFNVVPSIGVTVENQSQGDYYQISSKTKLGFNITLFNSSGQAKSGVIDYLAHGF